MPSESVIWTLLPTSVDPKTGELCSTIFVSPRLGADGPNEPLADFPSFRHWPDTVARLKFLAEVDGGAQIELTLDHHRFDAPDPTTWDLLFGGKIGVDKPGVSARANDLASRRLYSYPADIVAKHVLSLYTAVGAESPTEHPPVTSQLLTDLANDLGHIGDALDGSTHYRMIDGWFDADPTRGDRPGRFVPGALATSRPASFLLANRFYDRYLNGERLRDRRGPLDPDHVPPGPDRPVLDFHRYVAALGDYPQLMRRLALAIDVRMPADPVFTKHQRYRLAVKGDAAAWMNAPAATPWTHYQRDDTFFLPAASPAGRHDLKDGQLQLNSDFYAVHQIDIDGSALKTTNVASTITRRLTLIKKQKGATMAPTTSSLPALRGAGLTIVRRNAAASVVGQFDRTVEHSHREDTGQRTDLFADDLIRGYRYEAERDGSGEFRSLVDRVGTYRYHRPDGTIVLLDLPRDQGYVKGSSTTSIPNDKDLYLHEAIASWGGWSMVTPRPGGGVTRAETLDGGRTPFEQDESNLDRGIPLETVFRATPGSLPRLRYGSTYRLRARTVDLAGNSVAPEVIDDKHASNPVTFKRWEPVPAPVVVPRRTLVVHNIKTGEDTIEDAYGEGESQLRMVIRSTAGTTVADYLALPRVIGLAHKDAHGKTANSLGLPYLPTDERWIVAPKTSQQMAEFHGVFDEAIGSGDPAKIEAAYQIACREAGELAPAEPADDLEIPYLPDVSSRGVRFNHFPSDPAGCRRVDWPTNTGQWWDRRPIRVVLATGPAAAPVTPAANPQPPSWDGHTRTLTVHVPQAEIVTVRVSSAVDAPDLDIQGMYERILAHAGGAGGQRTKEALESRNWMLTPWVDLTFVHAVEKPLADPAVVIAAAGVHRNLGETFCSLHGAIANHAKSTGRIDVDAAWTEQVDDITEDVPADGLNGADPRALHSHVGDFLIESFEDSALVGRDDLTTPTGKGNTHRLRHEFGDTRHRVVDYTARATTRFREYFPPAVVNGVDETTTESLITRRGTKTRLHVPSSRRPDPPDIAYVIPTFTWTEDEPPTPPFSPVQGFVPQSIRRRIRRGGLRVYLRRPWYSSGDGEQLGVVLQDQPWLTWPADQKAGLSVEDADRLRADGVIAKGLAGGAVALDGPEGLSLSERFLRGAGVDVGPLGTIVARSGELKGFDAITGLLGGANVRDLLGRNHDTWLTRVGTDPVFAGTTVPSNGPFIHQFPLRASVRGGLPLKEADGLTVTVVGHTPKFDADRNLWYCDIDLTAGPFYQPFVRLALCRYQPHSIEGCHISRVVPADFAQLIPDRAATVTVAVDQRIAVSLRGPSGFGILGAGRDAVRAVSATRAVTATVQSLALGQDPDLGWTDVSLPVELAATVGAEGLRDVSWRAELAAVARRNGWKYRVLLQEFEIHPTDDGDAEDPFDAVANRPVTVEKHEAVRRRLVYADTFSL